MEYPSLDKPKAGAFRFNTDSSQMEIYDGNQWTGVLATSPNQQTGGTRGLIGAGTAPSPANNTNIIDYVTISSTGDFADFGDLTDNSYGQSACASRVRAIWGRGYAPADSYQKQYITP